jgi:hypothetical protein
LLYVLGFLLWLLFMCFPTVAVVLAVQEQIQIGEAPGRHWRIFLISEEDARGIGVERTGPREEPAGCAQTNVSFLLWAGESEATSYCQCYNEQGGVVSAGQGACVPE